MRLAVTLLIRDEKDVAAAWVEYYLAQGVDTIIVTDNGSVDGTLEVLQQYAALGLIHLILEPDDDYKQAEWVTRMARLAATDHAADWVLNIDADEFWRSADPALTLKQVLEALPPQAASLVAIRHDLRGKGGRAGGWLRRLRWLDRETVSERGTPLAPKLAHRALATINVEMGNHSVLGLEGERVEAGPIEIVHVPLRSWEQFSRKIRIGGAAVARNPNLGPGTSWHWRADFERLQNGTLEAEYWARAPKREELKNSARFSRETRLRSELRKLVKNARLPQLLTESLHS